MRPPLVSKFFSSSRSALAGTNFPASAGTAAMAKPVDFQLEGPSWEGAPLHVDLFVRENLLTYVGLHNNKKESNLS